MHFITGSASIKIKEPLLSIAKAGLFLKNLEKDINLTKDTLEIKGFFEPSLVHDFLLFLEKNAIVKNAFFLCIDKENEKKYEILSTKGIFYLYKYMYNKDKKVKQPFNYFLNALYISNTNLQFDDLNATIEDIKNLNMALSYLKSKRTEYIDDARDLLSFFIEKLNFVELAFNEEKVVLNDFSLKYCYTYPYQRIENGEKLNSISTFFQTIEYDKNETRKIKIGSYTLPLTSSFMDKSKENIIMPNGTISDNCSQCVFRIRKLTKGCFNCFPSKT